MQRPHSATMAPASHWASLPCDVLAIVLEGMPQEGRVAAAATCKGWRSVTERPGMWRHIEFATAREGTRRSELRRLLSLAAWAQRHATATESLAISARVSPDCQPAALKAVSMAALAAAGTLCTLSVTTNRGFWPGAWLRRLTRLRKLHLSSMEGGLSLHGDLSPLEQLTTLVLEAKQAVTLQEHVRLPPGVLHCELSCIRDVLPPPLSQLTCLQSLAVQRGVVSEGILLTEYECLVHLKGLTSLVLERQEEEAWLPPPELLSLTLLRHLSIAGNDCSRWPLHGSDEAFDLMLGRMGMLTSLDISGCGMEALPRALLREENSGGGTESAGDEEAGPRHVVSLPPRLRQLLAHGNQLEGEDEGEGEGDGEALLVFPRSLRQLSVDWQVLQHLRPQAAMTLPEPTQTLVLPPHCHQLALLGREGIDASLLEVLPELLPELRQLLLEPHALDMLWWQQRAASSSSSVSGRPGTASSEWQLVGSRWRPTHLPGQPRQQQPQRDVQQVLQVAGIEVVELQEASELPALLDQLAAQRR